jgi:hypothetical protein
MSIIGSFVVAPLDGGETRDLQTLHFDFGLPLDPKIEQQVARYTALSVPADVTGVFGYTLQPAAQRSVRDGVLAAALGHSAKARSPEKRGRDFPAKMI